MSGCIVPIVYRHPIGRTEPFPKFVQVFRPGGDGAIRTYVPRLGPCEWRPDPESGEWRTGCGRTSPIRIGEFCPYCSGEIRE